jgi:hypothetical protein
MESLIAKLISSRWLSRRTEINSLSETLKWWELRRIPYNVFVGLTGLFTCAVLVSVAAVASEKSDEPLGLPDPPIFAVFGVVLYGIMANVCYTGGWIAEWLVRKIWKERAGAFGEMAFCLGLVFSILLTLFPAVLFTGLLIIRLTLHR